MMTYLWLFGNESFWHWIAKEVVGFIVIAVILTPIYKRIDSKLDPTTKGGVGDIPDRDGVPAYKRIENTKKKE